MIGSIILTLGLLGQCYSQSYSAPAGAYVQDYAAPTAASCYSQSYSTGVVVQEFAAPMVMAAPIAVFSPMTASCYSGAYTAGYGVGFRGGRERFRMKYRGYYRSW